MKYSSLSMLLQLTALSRCSSDSGREGGRERGREGGREGGRGGGEGGRERGREGGREGEGEGYVALLYRQRWVDTLLIFLATVL